MGRNETDLCKKSIIHQAELARLENEIKFLENCIETSPDTVDLLDIEQRLQTAVAQLEKLVRVERIQELGLKLISTN